MILQVITMAYQFDLLHFLRINMNPRRLIENGPRVSAPHNVYERDTEIAGIPNGMQLFMDTVLPELMLTWL